MTSSLDAFPAELFLEVVKYLTHHDLAQLMRVSHRLHQLIEPVVWTKIELHRFSFHEDNALVQLRQGEAALQRPYRRPANLLNRRETYWVDNLDRDQDVASTLFLNLFCQKTLVDRHRAEHLAGLVRWLCVPVNGWNANLGQGSNADKLDPWNALATLKNLEYLEISALWKSPDEVEPFKGGAQPLSKLQTLKLRGYIPAEFVRYACANPSTITELQLAILDAPIGSILCRERPNPPPPADPEDDEPEDFDQEVVAPRPLACLTPEIISQFTSLTHLYLCRPCDGPEPAEGYTDICDIYTSIKSDTRALKEWASLIRSTRSHLSQLTLDQRPVGNSTEPDATENAEFLEEYCNGPGYLRFVELVLPALLEDADWPALRRIRLFGFENETPGEKSHDLVGRLKEWFGDGVDVVNGRGRRIIMEDDTGEVQSGGDALDTCNSFDEEDEGETPLWQIREGSAWGDWSFGSVPRLA
ncbi:hypothetical protein BU26DRAFT_515585 [Trematosphaeria pertusa]|uniref:F-box domain-containing protein n=1 Tax=Trematosphaeria pertusa TaxID=390896 RepID=A0A6A6IRU9_9PLEO|nr:uncharacterized protein BU26DRAFT_515585 [Trematosphaeria pertusa]KAF2253211.1 hypothetical protein BU26DRAFT_515585 [Trematosphaeria pertusa]